MEVLITLVVAVLVFALLWYVISLIPFPAGFPPAIRSVLYILLLLVAAYWLWTRFGR